MEKSNVAEQPAATPKEDKKATLKALCMFFGIIALCAGGYILYDKVIAKQDKLQCETVKEDEKKPAEEKKGEEVAEIASKGFKADVGYGKIYVTKAGDVYLEPYEDAYVGALSKKIEFSEDALPGEKGAYKLKTEEIGGKELYQTDAELDIEEVEFDGYKIDLENIVSVYDVTIPAHVWGGWTTVFIDKDGITHWMRIYDNGSNGKCEATSIISVDEYKNIASIIDRYDYGKVLLVTRDGGHIVLDTDKLFNNK